MATPPSRSLLDPGARPFVQGFRTVRDTVVGFGQQTLNTLTSLHSFKAPQNGEWYPYMGAIFEPRGEAVVQGARAATTLMQAVGLAARPEDRAASAARRPLIASTQFDTRVEGVRALSFAAAAPGADWGVEGREGALVSVYLDGRYHADVAVLSERPGRYEVNLGGLQPGRHSIELRAALDTAPAGAPAPTVADVQVEKLRGLRADVARHAPILEGRDLGLPYGTAETATTDTPLLLVPHVKRHENGTRTISYAALFSNEDGGTYTKDLYRTKGRATDYETVYSVTLDRTGKRVSERYQGPRHTYYSFQGEHVGERPVLRVATSNNNFSQNLRGGGTTWSPVPEPLTQRKLLSFELMLKHPWTFPVMAKELLRQNRTVNGVLDTDQPAALRIADPREYLYLQGTRDQVRAALDAGRGVSLLLADGSAAQVTMSPNYAVKGEATAIRLPGGVAADTIAGVAQLKGNVYLLGSDFMPRKLATGLPAPAAAAGAPAAVSAAEPPLSG